MTFWLYQPSSIKNAALLPTGGMGNFLNTVTIAIITMLALVKTKFKNLETDNLYVYLGAAFILTTLMGLVFCREEEEDIDTKYHMDLFYE